MKRIPVAYVTKWALSRGILIYRDVRSYNPDEIDICLPDNTDMAVEHPDWHQSEATAQERAKAMRQVAISATQRKLNRLLNLTVKVREANP